MVHTAQAFGVPKPDSAIQIQGVYVSYSMPDDDSKPPGRCPRPWLLGTISLLSVFVIGASDAAAYMGTNQPDGFSKDAMLQAAATIAGFTIFGSVIGHVFQLKRWQRWTRIAVYSGIMSLLITQFVFLGSICCDSGFSKDNTMLWLLATALFMVAIVFCLAIAASDQANQADDDQ